MGTVNEIACPRCGAELHVDADVRLHMCTACGQAFHVATEMGRTWLRALPPEASRDPHFQHLLSQEQGIFRQYAAVITRDSEAEKLRERSVRRKARMLLTANIVILLGAATVVLINARNIPRPSLVITILAVLAVITFALRLFLRTAEHSDRYATDQHKAELLKYREARQVLNGRIDEFLAPGGYDENQTEH